jgi:anchored repeat ABC transporter substrate-binding protein
VALAAALVVVGVLGACAEPVGLSPSDGRIQVVTTTGILRDLVANVGGDRVRVTSLVPDGADPHSHEPSLRSVRDVVHADVAFSNYLLLEQQSLISTLDANLAPEAENVSLAEEAVAYAAELIPLVEDVTLDTLWLGLRVRGSGADVGADRSSRVLLSATGLDAPGDLIAYVTGSFGEPRFAADSTDGFDPGSGYDGDTSALPPAAHSHMSWAFTEPGVYRLDLRASLALSATARPRPVATTTVTFAVGVDPGTVPGMAGAAVLDAGHADVTVDLDRDEIVLLHDGDSTDPLRHDPAATVLAVPNRARQEVPGDPALRFLGRPGEPVYQLPQAVLGRHVHGEIDPHLWHDIDNAVAYVNIIRDTLTRADPTGAATYRDNARAFVGELEDLDREIDAELSAVPASRRHLITTHDAFRYLARDRDFDIAGFVTPNPATEPSLADRRRLAETIRNLRVPAVFLEPNLIARSSMLTEVAEAAGVEVCPLRGDTFDAGARTYVELMRANARSLRRCLAP